MLRNHSNDSQGATDPIVVLVGQEEDQVVDDHPLRVTPALVPDGLPLVAIPTIQTTLQTRGVTEVPAEILLERQRKRKVRKDRNQNAVTHLFVLELVKRVDVPKSWDAGDRSKRETGGRTKKTAWNVPWNAEWYSYPTLPCLCKIWHSFWMKNQWHSLNSS